MGAQRGYQSAVRTSQLNMHCIPFHVTDVSGTPTFKTDVKGAEDLGGASLTLTDNGTGDYTLTLKTPAARTIIAPAPCPDVANLQPQCVSRSASAIRFKFTNNSGTAVDTGFAGVLFVHDDIVVRG